MANITLDNQILFTLPVAADRKSMSQNHPARHGDPSVAPPGGPKSPLLVTYDPRRGSVGASQDDAILISSDKGSEYSNLDDDASDHGDLEDGKSDTPLPSVEELLSCTGNDVKPGSVAGADQNPNTASGAGGDGYAAEPPVTHGPDCCGRPHPNNQSYSCSFLASFGWLVALLDFPVGSNVKEGR